MAELFEKSKLHIGTSGWSYQHWSGNFYPYEIKPAGYLEYYITKFDCVELNSSFYHLPQAATVSGWVKRTEESFRFCPKLSKYITHQLQLNNIYESLQHFFTVFEGMKFRLGPILIQLPPGMAFDLSLVSEFICMLDNYKGYRFAIEIRHKSWITDTFLNLLSEHNTGLVIADSGKRFPSCEAVTTDFVYLRYHGREKLYASNYNDTELILIAEKIIKWLNDDKEVWVFFNNDYGGFAPKNAEQLRYFIIDGQV